MATSSFLPSTLGIKSEVPLFVLTLTPDTHGTFQVLRCSIFSCKPCKVECASCMPCFCSLRVLHNHMHELTMHYTKPRPVHTLHYCNHHVFRTARKLPRTHVKRLQDIQKVQEGKTQHSDAMQFNIKHKLRTNNNVLHTRTVLPGGSTHTGKPNATGLNSRILMWAVFLLQEPNHLCAVSAKKTLHYLTHVHREEKGHVARGICWIVSYNTLQHNVTHCNTL